MRQASGLGHAGLCTVLLATKNMPLDASTVGRGTATAAHYRTQDAADIQPAVIVL